MKTQKLLVMATIVCLLVGVSSATIAETLDNCDGGFISGGEYEGIELSLGGTQDCVIVGVTVTGAGGVRVINPSNFIMMNSYIKGVVRVARNSDGVESTAALLYNFVDGYNMVAVNLNEADVRWNTVIGGNIRVVDRDNTPSTYAEVIQNRETFA